MPLQRSGFEMLIWRFPSCCRLPDGGVGVNCNVWGWTLVHIYWGQARASGDPPTGCFCERPILSGPPSCRGASSLLAKEWKRELWRAIPLLLLLFGVAHTLFPLWRSYSCGGVCVGLPLIHRSSFTLWETWGWASHWHQAFFVNECPAQHPAGLSLRCLYILQSRSEEHHCGAAKG